jgi:carbon starvation protein
MNVAIPLLVSLPIMMLAYKFYARYISRAIGLDPSRKGPSMMAPDDRDYVPTKRVVLFAHHFASIAGAGPIIGPTVALLYGYVPVWLWLIIGSVLFGAAHDFTALFVSIRERGKSMAEVANRTLGRTGFILFISFTIIMLILVTSAFLGLTAKALTSLTPLSSLGLDSSQKILKTVNDGGVLKGKIGGIASTSVILMTIIAPLIGFLLYRKKVNATIMSVIGVAVAVFAIYIGFLYPLMLNAKLWMLILSVYSLFAAGLPVWIVLQPRDFTNVHILYVGIFALTIGLLIAGAKGLTIQAPAFNIAAASQNPHLGAIWPVLFITVACGAISGFHSLVSGGTSSKQIRYEGDARGIGFGSMILESILAICVVLAIAAGLKFTEYTSLVFPAGAAKSNPVLAFALGVGSILHTSVGVPKFLGSIFGILMIEGFIITSLDTAVRLNRYLFEELWLVLFRKPAKIFKSYLFNAGIAVTLMLFLAYTNAYLTIWPIFGTANQLLAALTLIAVSVWLIEKKRKAWFTIYPAVFMLITTLASLILLLFTKYLPTQNIPLVITDLLLLCLSVGVFAQAINVLVEHRRGRAAGKDEVSSLKLDEAEHLRD